MARLTEPEASANPGETIESLKRKFLRQNRDLIRTNATQSAKIRSLEIQISNLLAENLSFRDTIIHLQVELDESRHRAVVENVNAIQRQLEEKLRECTDIVAQLGQVQKKSRRNNSPVKQRSPDQREWRTRATLSEILETQPGHLPTITEGKHYPRKTLDANEINTIISEASSASPDAGPPPQIHLDDDVLNTNHFEHSTDVQLDQAERRESGLLSANFETRKRRRETYVRADDEVSSLQVPNTLPDLAFLKTPEKLSGKPIRAGRKRRLSAQQALEGQNIEMQGFEHTKKDAPTSNASIDSKFAVDEPLVENGQNITALQRQGNSILDDKPSMPQIAAVQPDLSPQRSVLGSKTTNMSPRKIVQHSDSKKGASSVQNPRKFASTGHRVEQEVMKIPARVAVPQVPDVVDISVENIKLEPKTPALADLLSPSSTHPSEVRAGSRDTPPPGELLHPHGTTDGMNAAGRGSRRARAQVNYAEPNLVSKMRRPTKQLVDAVGGDAKENKRHSGSVEVMAEENPALKIVTIKKEHETGGGWKPTTSSVMQELSRPEPQSPIQPKRETRQSPDAVITAEQKDLERKMETMAIFDVQTSSPVKLPESDSSVLQPIQERLASEKQPAATTVKTLGSRRQSVLPSTSARSRPALTAKDDGAASNVVRAGQNRSAVETAGKTSDTDRGLAARGRRRSMLL